MVATGYLDESPEGLTRWIKNPATWGYQLANVPSIQLKDVLKLEVPWPELRSIVDSRITGAIQFDTPYRFGSDPATPFDEWVRNSWKSKQVVVPLVVIPETVETQARRTKFTTERIPIPVADDEAIQLLDGYELYGKHAPLLQTLDVGSFVAEWLTFSGLQIVQMDFNAKKNLIQGYRLLEHKDSEFYDGVFMLNILNSHWVAVAPPSLDSCKQQQRQWRKRPQERIQNDLDPKMRLWNR